MGWSATKPVFMRVAARGCITPSHSIRFGGGHKIGDSGHNIQATGTQNSSLADCLNIAGLP
jgi:hypothetical protein